MRHNDAKNPQPLVSIAMCTYNGEIYLTQQLDSILNQSYSHLEIIICDDCSTDKTPEILKEYAKKDSRVKIFLNPTNVGFNRNFERAISLSSGEYISISDQDDIWETNKIEELLHNIGDDWLIFSNSSYIDNSGTQLKGKLLRSFNIEGKDYRSILLENFVTGHTMLFTKNFISYVLPIPASGYYDWYFGFVALYHKKLGFLNKPLTKYRLHPKSVIQKTQLVKEFYKYKFQSHNLQREAFINYKNLRGEDRNYIKNLHEMHLQKWKGFAFKLFLFVYTHYELLFPAKIKRGCFRRLKFAYLYSRRADH